MTHKSRRARLSSSEGTWSYDWDSDDSPIDWSRIEQAYGRHELDAGTRAEIITLVKTYFLDDSFERHAHFVNDAIEWIGQLDKFGSAFSRAAAGVHLNETKREMAWHVIPYIEGYLNDPHLGEVNQFQNLIESMENFVAAARLTKKFMSETRGFVEGHAWDNLIIGLTNVAKARHLPWKVSKGLDKASVEEPSDFVRLVRALQDTFLEPFRRHQITYAAAATAICDARARKREISPVEG